MESLAVLVAILFLIAVFAGPFAILLSSTRIKSYLHSKNSIFFQLLDVLRKTVHIFAIILGLLVGFQLISVAVTAGKVVGIIAVSTCYIALRREYFPDFYVIAVILSKIGVRKIAPGDHGPSLKWKRNSRSSGHDGHGPEGQH